MINSPVDKRPDFNNIQEIHPMQGHRIINVF
jgi:hypothetical protein